MPNPEFDPQRRVMLIIKRLSVVQCSLEHVIGIVFLTEFQWHEANVLDNWHLAQLPQSGGREFDPRRVHANLSVPLRVYMRSLYQSITIKPQKICQWVRS